MDFAYSYKARNASEYTSGIIVAGSLNRAYYQAKLLKVQATSVQLDLVATVRLLIGGQTGAKSELSLFYRSLAGRLDSGDHTGIHVVFQDALAYVSDVRLRQQIQFAGLALASSGSPLPEAMRLAGFPQRDCTVLAATHLKGSALNSV